VDTKKLKTNKLKILLAILAVAVIIADLYHTDSIKWPK